MSYTDPPLAELKSSSRNFVLGKKLEDIAIHFFVSKGFQKKDPKMISKKIQIDGLLFNEREGWIVLEVKSLPVNEFDLLNRVSKKQARRIQRFMSILEQKTVYPVRAHLAIVSHEGHIELYEDFLCDLIET